MQFLSLIELNSLVDTFIVISKFQHPKYINWKLLSNESESEKMARYE